MLLDLLDRPGRCSGSWPHDSMVVRSPAAPSPVLFSGMLLAESGLAALLIFVAPTRARLGGAMLLDLLDRPGRCSGSWPHDSMVRSPAAPSPVLFSGMLLAESGSGQRSSSGGRGDR